MTWWGDKIARQMDRRGWTEALIQTVIDAPERVETARDTRRHGALRMNEAATAYYIDHVHYVVRSDITGEILQVSDRRRTVWHAPWE